MQRVVYHVGMTSWRRFLSPFILLFGLGGCGPSDLEHVVLEIRDEFPHVRQLSTGTLATWLADPARPAPVLLDVRAPAEFAVSHLPHASQVTPGAPLDDAVLSLDRSTPIVAYCSVGYRSSRFVERLREAGFTDVYNLEGSVFAWANEGRMVVRDDRPVDEVHPYNRAWGRLLDREHHPAAGAIDGLVTAPVGGS